MSIKIIEICLDQSYKEVNISKIKYLWNRFKVGPRSVWDPDPFNINPGPQTCSYNPILLCYNLFFAMFRGLWLIKKSAKRTWFMFSRVTTRTCSWGRPSLSSSTSRQHTFINNLYWSNIFLKILIHFKSLARKSKGNAIYI